MNILIDRELLASVSKYVHVVRMNDTHAIVTADRSVHSFLSHEGKAKSLPIPENVTILRLIERDHIIMVLKNCDGNKSKASRELGISLNTLYNRLERYQYEG